MDDRDQRVRLAAFKFLDQLRHHEGETLSYDGLNRGFVFEGQRVPLIAPQGIFKPAVLDLLSASRLHRPPRASHVPTMTSSPQVGCCGIATEVRTRSIETTPVREAMRRQVPLV